MAAETNLSRATVERYPDLLNLDETLTAWAERGDMTMTDAYELARKKNQYLHPIVEQFVADAADKGDFPALVHRAIAYGKSLENPLPPVKEKPAVNPLRTVDSFGRAIRRSTAQLKSLNLKEEMDKAAARKMLDYSPGFWLDVENGRRNPPSIDKLKKIVALLELSAQESDMLYDAAGDDSASKLPPDLADIVQDTQVRKALRIAKEKGGQCDWNTFIERLERK